VSFFRRVQTILEANKTLAAKEAQARGWSDSGHGDWYDSEGNLRGKTVNGRLQVFQGKAKKKPEEPAAEKEEKPQKVSGDSLTIGFGRFNPPTKGHEKLIQKIATTAGKGGTYKIYPSRSHDTDKNPLEPTEKIGYMHAMFPDEAANILDDANVRTIFDVLKRYGSDDSKERYSSINIVVGDDRLKEFTDLADKYNGRLYNFKKINVVSAGRRDADAEGVEGMSSSKLRKAALENDFDLFRSGIPKTLDDKAAKKLFNTVRKSIDTKGSTTKKKSDAEKSAARYKEDEKGKKAAAKRRDYASARSTAVDDALKKHGTVSKHDEEVDLWMVAPKLDPIGLRENYFKKIIFNIGDMVENLNHGLIGKITRRGTNHIIAVTEDNIMFKSWIKDLKEYTEKHMERRMRDKTHPNTLVGTGGYRKNTMAAIPGGLKKITNFKEQYPIINKLRQQYRSAKGNEGL